jgi:hypothetical protein
METLESIDRSDKVRVIANVSSYHQVYKFISSYLIHWIIGNTPKASVICKDVLLLQFYV